MERVFACLILLCLPAVYFSSCDVNDVVKKIKDAKGNVDVTLQIIASLTADERKKVVNQYKTETGESIVSDSYTITEKDLAGALLFGLVTEDVDVINAKFMLYALIMGENQNYDVSIQGCYISVQIAMLLDGKSRTKFPAKFNEVTKKDFKTELANFKKVSPRTASYLDLIISNPRSTASKSLDADIAMFKDEKLDWTSDKTIDRLKVIVFVEPETYVSQLCKSVPELADKIYSKMPKDTVDSGYLLEGLYLICDRKKAFEMMILNPLYWQMWTHLFCTHIKDIRACNPGNSKSIPDILKSYKASAYYTAMLTVYNNGGQE